MINGRIELAKATFADRKEILREVRRYCPDVQLRESEPKIFPRVYVGNVSFYEDYRLIALRWRGETEKSFVGFYTKGDFRPLDQSGDAIRHLNAVAPLNLNRNNVLSYVLLRLGCEQDGYGLLRWKQRPPRQRSDFERAEFLLESIVSTSVEHADAIGHETRLSL